MSNNFRNFVRKCEKQEEEEQNAEKLVSSLSLYFFGKKNCLNLKSQIHLIFWYVSRCNLYTILSNNCFRKLIAKFSINLNGDQVFLFMFEKEVMPAKKKIVLPEIILNKICV